jgi:hypothetical protein
MKSEHDQEALYALFKVQKADKSPFFLYCKSNAEAYLKIHLKYVNIVLNKSCCNIYLLFGILLFCQTALSQEISWGSGNYTSYQQGTLPIIISVPHGGYDSPISIPDRTCPGAVLVRDAFTLELSEQINQAFLELTGCVPYIITCHISRRKVDCNRNLADGTCNNSQAMVIYNDYHNFIKQAQQNAIHVFDKDLFFIDLHGHGHTLQRIELGYLLFADELNRSDAFLDSDAAIRESSIQSLVPRNVRQFGHAALIRGSSSLGTLLGNSGFPSVPSTQIPSPGNDPYFSGGFITANYTSYAPLNQVPGLQMELNFTGIRDTPENRRHFARTLAITLLDYLNIHYEWEKESCLVTDLPSPVKPFIDFKIYPSPAIRGSDLFINYVGHMKEEQEVNIEIVNVHGIPTFKNKVQLPFRLPTNHMPSGYYRVMVKTSTAHKTLPFILLE